MTTATTTKTRKTTRAAKAAAIVGRVCLYGTHATYPPTGAGWLASINPAACPEATARHFAKTGASTIMLGDGEPHPGCGFTAALWLALSAMQAATGLTAGTVEVFEPTGLMVAHVAIAERKYFGDLAWKPGYVLVLSAEEIVAAAEQQNGQN